MSKSGEKTEDTVDSHVFNYEDDFAYEDFGDESIPEPFLFPPELNSHLKTKIHRVISQDLTLENSSLRQTLQGTEGKLLEKKNSHEDRPKTPANDSSKDEEMKALQERLNQANSKYYKCQNACLTLRQELHKAQKLLCSEVGENVTITGLLNHPGGWKGRAEQIQHLQQKISDLQHKLSDSEKSSRGSSISLELRSSYRTKSVERDRKTQVEHLGKELRQAETALEGNRRKLEAARARIKVLENELSDSKRTIIILNDRKAHDDQLIQALNGQLRAVEDRYKERNGDSKKRMEKITQECSNLKNELHSARLLTEQLRKKLSERETEIYTLRSGAVSSISTNSRDLPDDFCEPSPLDSDRGYQDPNEYVVLGVAAEAERERLMDVVAALNRRLDKERADTDHVSELLRRERTKVVRLENRLQKIEAEAMTRPRVNSGYRARTSKSLTPFKNELNDDQFKFKLELLEEENLAVKARLATLQQEKIEDLSTYKQLLENTKKIFHESLRGKISTAHSTLTV
ncbi:coiled-coil domain-containing protein 13 isoform X2 [Diachasmimorpha longicaudata]|uniref:coiled-coil domain-containing protein 13 isoform X2 n=1 Tax=Diachasmimorpha longicaudata TaxID=58733 RepID=UPI0030B8D74C